jgi:hypothetical protein
MKRLLFTLWMSATCFGAMAQDGELIALINTCINYTEVAGQLPQSPPIVVLDNGTVPHGGPLRLKGQEVLLLNLESISQRALQEHLRFSQIVLHSNKAYVVLHLPQRRLKVTMNLSRNNGGWQVHDCSHREF